MIKKILLRIYKHLSLYYFVKHKIKKSKNSIFIGRPIINNSGKITIGDNCVFVSDQRFNDIQLFGRMFINVMSSHGIVNIGTKTAVSSSTICAYNKVMIGENCLIGANVLIADSDFHLIHNPLDRNDFEKFSLTTKPVIIGDNVFIGTGAVVLKGTVIGNNCVIGANSVVSGDIPENSIYAGNPARQIGIVNDSCN